MRFTLLLVSFLSLAWGQKIQLFRAPSLGSLRLAREELFQNTHDGRVENYVSSSGVSENSFETNARFQNSNRGRSLETNTKFQNGNPETGISERFQESDIREFQIDSGPLQAANGNFSNTLSSLNPSQSTTQESNQVQGNSQFQINENRQTSSQSPNQINRFNFDFQSPSNFAENMQSLTSARRSGRFNFPSPRQLRGGPNPTPNQLHQNPDFKFTLPSILSNFMQPRSRGTSFISNSPSLTTDSLEQVVTNQINQNPAMKFTIPTIFSNLPQSRSSGSSIRVASTSTNPESRENVEFSNFPQSISSGTSLSSVSSSSNTKPQDNVVFSNFPQSRSAGFSIKSTSSSSKPDSRENVVFSNFPQSRSSGSSIKSTSTSPNLDSRVVFSNFPQSRSSGLSIKSTSTSLTPESQKRVVFSNSPESKSSGSSISETSTGPNPDFQESVMFSKFPQSKSPESSIRSTSNSPTPKPTEILVFSNVPQSRSPKSSLRSTSSSPTPKPTETVVFSNFPQSRKPESSIRSTSTSLRPNSRRPNSRRRVVFEPENTSEREVFEPLNLPAGASALLGTISTSFSCEGLPYGYYADSQNSCNIFHICNPVLYDDGYIQNYQYSFMCGETLVFDQLQLACVVPNDITHDCKDASSYFFRNEIFGTQEEA